MKLKNNLIRIYTSVTLAILSIYNFTVYATTLQFHNSQLFEISEGEFTEAFSLRNKYQIKVDTVTSPQICKIVHDKMIERLDNMQTDEALIYNIQDFNSNLCTIVKFPFGLLAAVVHTSFWEYEYWFFNESDYTFIANTGTLPKINGVQHCVSKEGYMVTWRNHSYDSNVDISVYRLQNDNIRLIHRYDDVKISNWEQVCWSAGNTFYIRGEYNDDDDEMQYTGKFGIKYIRLTVSQ